MGTLAALAMLQQSIAAAGQISALLATAHAEKRDVTMEELNGLAAVDDLAKAALAAAIAKNS
jgi:hypothetical protein